MSTDPYGEFLDDYFDEAPDAITGPMATLTLFDRDGNQDGPSSQVPCVDPADCEHVETICPECLESWEIDYEVLLPRA